MVNVPQHRNVDPNSPGHGAQNGPYSDTFVSDKFVSIPIASHHTRRHATPFLYI